ncbi:natriuretic peptide A-like isoform X1 [Anarrhichthys ocellatus]|uniref:natriuretic peptide A-like isoform X1 n=1 Tax=Anarrhichthys ocellatus TaxID=433405 RepID=UPI0012ED9EB2|nr:C-type natriuretic peptide 3-like isoform X1 [Anarrhichthys ocellatus]
MNAHILVCCLSLLLLLNFVGAKPVSELQLSGFSFSPQSLKQLLEEEINTAPYYSSEEEKDGNTDKSLFEAPEEQPWDSSDPSNLVLEAKESLLARIFKDLMRTSKRSWSRNKKGGLRSCFGVRLERIGSFSGLGC